MTLEQACPPEYQWAQCAFKDSMTHGNSAIRITYRISLRSSSMPKPRDPLLKVFGYFVLNNIQTTCFNKSFGWGHRRARARESDSPAAVLRAGPPKQQLVW